MVSGFMQFLKKNQRSVRLCALFLTLLPISDGYSVGKWNPTGQLCTPVYSRSACRLTRLDRSTNRLSYNFDETKVNRNLPRHLHIITNSSSQRLLVQQF